MKDNPGVVQKYLNVLTSIGILEKIPVFEKNKFRYFHKSPLFDIHYYLEGKYSYTEVDTPPGFIRQVVNEKMPKQVEQFFRNLLVKIFGLQPTIIEKRDMEIDISLVKFKKIKVVAEVKWKNFISKKEIRNIELKLKKFKGCKKLLIVPSLDVLEVQPEDIDVWDVKKLLKIARKSLTQTLNNV